MVIDCANGVGAHAAQKLAQYLGETLPFVLHNVDTVTPGGLNHECGADYVKTSQRPPPSLIGVLQKGQRACSLDGDADRLMYYFIDERNYFLMLDGDKIATLVASFIVDLVRLAGLSDSVRVGVVQTAYANGASTKYLSEVSSLFTITLSSSHTTSYTEAAREMHPYRSQASSSCCRAVQRWCLLRSERARNCSFLPFDS